MNPRHPAPAGKLTALRDALSDEGPPSELLMDGPCHRPPLVTIGIPTFKRPEMVAEAVASALRQDFDRAVEIIVVDNDPSSHGLDDLLRRIPHLHDTCFRYFRNGDNVGLYGNWNRCITLARGEWVTVLNDDDLLDDNFLSLMFAELDKDRSIDGIVPRKRMFDQRGGGSGSLPEQRQFVSRRVNVASAFRMLFGRNGSMGLFVRRALDRLVFEYIYSWQMSRRIRPRNLFAGAMLGNGAGFLFRRSAAAHIGGYYPEEFPPADYWFYVRFAKLFHLREHRVEAASVRVAENESAKPDTVKGCFQSGYEVQKALAATDVPRWWLRFSPLILALHRRYHRDQWGYELSDREVQELVGMRVPAERPRLLFAARLLFKWF